MRPGFSPEYPRDAATVGEPAPRLNTGVLQPDRPDPGNAKPRKKWWLIPIVISALAIAAGGALWATGILSPGGSGNGMNSRDQLPWERSQAMESEEVTPSPTPTMLPTTTPTQAPAATAVPTETPALTDAPSPTATATPTGTPIPTATPDQTSTPTPTGTPVPTAMPAPTATAAPTGTPVPTATPEPTATEAPTGTPVPTETPAPTEEPEPLQEEEPAETKPAGSTAVTYPTYGRTTEKKVNVRYRADKKSRRVAYITHKGSLTEILGDAFDSNGERWYKVKLENGETGFVLASVIELQSESEKANFPFLAKTTSKKVNCRVEADTGSRRLTYIQQKGTVVSVLDEVIGEDQKPWYRIQLEDGRIGYARSEYFESENDSRATVESMNGNSAGVFTPVSAELTRNRKAEVYSGPGTGYLRPANGRAVLTTNNSAYIYGQENGMILIQYQVTGKQWRFGFISSEFVEDLKDVPPLSFEGKTASVVKKCNLTDDPLHSKGKLISLKLGQTVTCLAKMEKWVYVDTGTARGFISEENLKAD